MSTFPRNERIVLVFSYLVLLREMQEKEHSVKALQKVIQNVKAAPFEIFSGEQAIQQLKAGKTSAQYIDAIVNNTDASKSGIKEIDSMPPNEMNKLKVIMQMTKFEGVGVKTAERYYNAGYTTIEAFKEELERDGTDRQKVGIQYTDEFKKRIPRQKVDFFIQKFDYFLNIYNEHNGSILRYDVCGSYRRGKDTCGDMDIILWSLVPRQTKMAFSNLCEYLKTSGLLRETLSLGEDTYQGVACIDEEFPAVRLDIKCLDNMTEYYFATLYFTGSAELNEQMREKAKSMGLKLSNTEMKILHNNDAIHVRNEKDIFDLLGFEYKEPYMR